jgi:hypothetical protein
MCLHNLTYLESQGLLDTLSVSCSISACPEEGTSIPPAIGLADKGYNFALYAVTVDHLCHLVPARFGKEPPSFFLLHP